MASSPQAEVTGRASQGSALLQVARTGNPEGALG